MNLPSEKFQVDVQKYECLQFEQLLDDCLDGRDSISALTSNSHLQQCDDCQSTYGVYLQFDLAGGAVLNGGSRTVDRSPKSIKSHRKTRVRPEFWRTMGAVALTTSTAALLLFALASPIQRSDSNHISKNVAPLTPLPIALSEAGNASEFEEPLNSFPGDVDYISEIRSAVGYEAQPMLNNLYEAGELSGNLVTARLVAPFQRTKLLSGLSAPWQYTSELPGVRPIHRSVQAGYFLYQSSVSLL